MTDGNGEERGCTGMDGWMDGRTGMNGWVPCRWHHRHHQQRHHYHRHCHAAGAEVGVGVLGHDVIVMTYVERAVFFFWIGNQSITRLLQGPDLRLPGRLCRSCPRSRSRRPPLLTSLG